MLNTRVTPKCTNACPPVDKSHSQHPVEAFCSSRRQNAASISKHSFTETTEPHSKTRRNRQKRQRMVCQAEASYKPFGPGEIREIPIFPLQIVAFPGSDVPLNIFEARLASLCSASHTPYGVTLFARPHPAWIFTTTTNLVVFSASLKRRYCELLATNKLANPMHNKWRIPPPPSSLQPEYHNILHLQRQFLLS